MPKEKNTTHTTGSTPPGVPLQPFEINSTLQQILHRLDVLESGVKTFSSTIAHQKDVAFLDGRNIIVAKGTGTKIGTEATQKLGFFGTTPVVQQTAPSDPGSGSSASDGIARTAISGLITNLKNLGLIA